MYLYDSTRLKRPVNKRHQGGFPRSGSGDGSLAISTPIPLAAPDGGSLAVFEIHHPSPRLMICRRDKIRLLQESEFAKSLKWYLSPPGRHIIGIGFSEIRSGRLNYDTVSPRPRSTNSCRLHCPDFSMWIICSMISRTDHSPSLECSSTSCSG